MGRQARTQRGVRWGKGGGCTGPGFLGASPPAGPPSPGCPRQAAARRGSPLPQQPLHRASPLGWVSAALLSLSHLSQTHTFYPNNRLENCRAWERRQAVPATMSSPTRGQMGSLARRPPGKNSASRGETNRKGEGPATTSAGREGNQARPAYWFPIHSGKLTFQHQAPNDQVAATSGGGLTAGVHTCPAPHGQPRPATVPAPQSLQWGGVLGDTRPPTQEATMGHAWP